MSKIITQRELRNDSGAILREVQAGQTIIVTRNGVPAAELRAVPQRRFVSRTVIAELAAGPHATTDDGEWARRQDRLQWAVAMWEPLPLDAEATRAYGRVFAAARAVGRPSRARLADLLIAATAVAHGLPLYTRNPGDFIGLDEVVHVVAV